MKKRVIIIDADSRFREYCELLLGSSTELRVVATFETVEEALSQIPGTRPDIVVMDLDLPGAVNGIQGIRAFQVQYPELQILIFTAHEDTSRVIEALSAGALGYILKSQQYLELIWALEELIKGGSPMSSKVSRLLVREFQVAVRSPLTEREREILNALAVGNTLTQLSDQMGISRATAKTHVRNIYSKLKVNRKSEAIVKARKGKFI